VEEFKYLGTNITNQNSIKEKIKSKLRPGMLAISLCRIFCVKVCYPKSTITLPVVLCGCEIWSLALREEPGLRVFENRALIRIIGSKKNEVTGEWKQLRNEEFNDLSCSSNFVQVIK
jgi:hypothetical protein